MKIQKLKNNIIIKIPVKKFKEIFGEFTSEPKTMTDETPEVTPEVTPEPTPETPVEVPTEPTQEVAQ